jgi:hypothetical protein
MAADRRGGPAGVAGAGVRHRRDPDGPGRALLSNSDHAVSFVRCVILITCDQAIDFSTPEWVEFYRKFRHATRSMCRSLKPAGYRGLLLDRE